MSLSDLPSVNAILNSISAVLLIVGRHRIKNGEPDQHRNIMLTALVVSALFLTSYLIYHYNVGSVSYPKHDWTRPMYFIILIPHVSLAALMTPFIIIAVWMALLKKFEIHKKLVRWVWPVWIFVSFSGIIVYLMLYKF